MIEIVVNGVFAENFKETTLRHVFRLFSRTFCLVSFNSGWIITSDMMFVTCITQELLAVIKHVLYIFYTTILY